MNNIPPCLKHYLKDTTSGNRNNNLFTAMKKIKQLNPRSTRANLYKTCQELNKNFKDALNKRELRAITKSIHNNDYKASCLPFKQHCEPCKFCKSNRPYNTLNKNYFKHLTRKNQIKMLLPAIEAYPWDIEDLSKLPSKQIRTIMEFRSDKGINPYIDRVLKFKGLKIGDEALEEYQKHIGMIE